MVLCFIRVLGKVLGLCNSTELKIRVEGTSAEGIVSYRVTPTRRDGYCALINSGTSADVQSNMPDARRRIVSKHVSPSRLSLSIAQKPEAKKRSAVSKAVDTYESFRDSAGSTVVVAERTSSISSTLSRKTRQPLQELRVEVG